MNFYSKTSFENKSKYDFFYTITNFLDSHNRSIRVSDLTGSRIICLSNRLVIYLSQHYNYFEREDFYLKFILALFAIFWI